MTAQSPKCARATYARSRGTNEETRDVNALALAKRFHADCVDRNETREAAEWQEVIDALEAERTALAATLPLLRALKDDRVDYGPIVEVIRTIETATA